MSTTLTPTQAAMLGPLGMKTENFDVEMLLRMAHSPVLNYVVPGLTSSLIGAPSQAGTVRLFECEREQQEAVTPHSHRFDFCCLVLKGQVRNRRWVLACNSADRNGSDRYCSSALRYAGRPGEYEREPGTIAWWRYEDTVYGAGEWYGMKAADVHSIFFSRGAKVLFFEGPIVSDSSVILEPVVGGMVGEVVPTFKVEPWMFKREQALPISGMEAIGAV